MNAVKFITYIDVHPTLKMNYVEVPKQIVDEVGGIGTRLLCSVNGAEYFQCGMVALGEGRAYISLNKKRMEKLDLAKDDEIQVSLELDQSKYGLEMPEELKALLEQDNTGAQLFENLTDGQKRYIIYYVGQMKSSQLKIDRAILLINNLKTMPKEKFSFRHLLGLPPREQ